MTLVAINVVIIHLHVLNAIHNIGFLKIHVVKLALIFILKIMQLGIAFFVKLGVLGWIWKCIFLILQMTVFILISHLLRILISQFFHIKLSKKSQSIAPSIHWRCLNLAFKFSQPKVTEWLCNQKGIYFFTMPQ